MSMMESILREIYLERLQLEQELIEAQGSIDQILADIFQISKQASPFIEIDTKKVERQIPEKELMKALNAYYHKKKVSNPTELTSITYISKRFHISNSHSIKVLSRLQSPPTAFIEKQIRLFLTKLLINWLACRPHNQEFLILQRNRRSMVKEIIKTQIEEEFGKIYTRLADEIEKEYLKVSIDEWLEKSFFPLHLSDFTGENRTAPPLIYIRISEKISILVLSRRLSQSTLDNIRKNLDCVALKDCAIFVKVIDLLHKGNFSFFLSDGIKINLSIFWPFIQWKELKEVFRKILNGKLCWAKICQFHDILIELQRVYDSISSECR